MLPLSLAIVIFGFMLIEARRAARNERVQRARGGIEPPADAPVFRAMQAAYPASFGCMVAELAVRGAPGSDVLLMGAALFTAAKALKWWAILELGRFWTFRVIVLPGAVLVSRGPYRWVRHPNYVAVIGELAGTALMAGAIVSGPIAIALFAALIARRIVVEQRALDAARSGAAASKGN